MSQSTTDDESPLWSFRSSPPLKNKEKLKEYADLAQRVLAGCYGTRSSRFTETQDAQAFWDGYDGVKRRITPTHEDYIPYRLGKDVRRQDERVGARKKYKIGKYVASQIEYECWEALPDGEWISAPRLAKRLERWNDLSVGSALMMLATKGIIQRRSGSPPYYMKKST